MAISFEVVSLALNLIFGGSLILTLVTLRAKKKKADAEAEGTELDNVQKAIHVWREMAESMKAQRDEALSGFGEMSKQVEGLRKDVQKLNCTNQKILKLLDKISHENLEKTVEEMKEAIQSGNG
jgi:hypothetical protein